MTNAWGAYTFKGQEVVYILDDFGNAVPMTNAMAYTWCLWVQDGFSACH